MEDFFIFVLIVTTIWLFVRQSSLGKKLRELEDLYQRLARSTPSAPLQPAPPPRPVVVPDPPHAVPQSVAPVSADRRTPAPVIPYVAPYLPPTPPVEVPQRTTPQLTVSAPPPASTPEPAPRVSLEARLGQNWLNKLGIVILVIGVALLLGRELTTLGPLGKSLIGFALALGILGLGLFLERKPNYRIFARACIGGGWALTFFLSFAIYHLSALQILTSQTADLVLMLAVASGMVVHSLRYHSQVVTTLAFLLAFLTVGISDVTLFSLVAGALLAGALAFVVYRERWYALGLAGLTGVYLNHFLWLHRVLPDGGLVYKLHTGHAFPEFVPSAILLLSYWLIFRLVYVFRAPLEGPSHDIDQGLSTFAAIVNSVGLLGLMKFQSSHPEWAFYGLLVLGTAELVLSILARGIDPTKPRNRSGFIVLSTIASVLLLAAIPFRFNGASWPLLWLLEAEAFFLVGIRLPEIVFRRLGILAAFATSIYLVIAALLLIAADAGSSHITITSHSAPLNFPIVLFTGALVLWFNAEFTTRRWPFIATSDFDRAALRLTSYLAALLAALGFTVFLHPTSAWLGITWLVLALALATISDRLNASDLATQSDLLALAALIRTLTLLFSNASVPHYALFPTSYSLYFLTAALLYLGIKRKAASYLLPTPAIAPAYTWLAGGLVALLFWYQLEPISVAVAWGVFALVLFELGIVFKRDYLRHQAYALLAAAFIRIFFANLHVPSTAGGLSPSLYTVIPLIAAFAYVYERVHADTTTPFDKFAGTLASWFSVVAASTLLYYELRPEWIILAWTVLASVLLVLSWLRNRQLFREQAMVVLIVMFMRAAFSMFEPPALATTFFTSQTFTVGLVCAIMFLLLPVAFAIRRQHAAEYAALPPGTPIWKWLTPFRPEQPWFFIPLTLLTLLLYVQLRGGLITMGWVALGLITFLFALAVQSLAKFPARSYRLSGLGLLLLGVVKILAWDVWHVSPTDRYITLIVMGAALLLVSFLYSRYRETLLNFL